MAVHPKVFDLDALFSRLAAHRERLDRIVFIAGAFDLLHAGHVATLEAARHLGDVLVVGIRSDASVRQLKGPGRPVVPEAERAYLVASLASVDYVVIFAEDTPQSLLEAIRPTVLVKDGSTPAIAGLSTTNRIRQIEGIAHA